MKDIENLDKEESQSKHLNSNKFNCNDSCLLNRIGCLCTKCIFEGCSQYNRSKDNCEHAINTEKKYKDFKNGLYFDHYCPDFTDWVKILKEKK